MKQCQSKNSQKQDCPQPNCQQQDCQQQDCQQQDCQQQDCQQQDCQQQDCQQQDCQQQDCQQQDWLTPTWLRAASSAQAFARGERYAADGRVSAWQLTAGIVTAVVQGGSPYQVRIWQRRAAVECSCTCTFAAEGAVCKHIVAAGLIVCAETEIE